jgi:hypothetical protein
MFVPFWQSGHFSDCLSPLKSTPFRFLAEFESHSLFPLPSGLPVHFLGGPVEFFGKPREKISQ